ncbi:hypothetical protein [Xanthomonas campestris]|nr:hypothetical protein [Xanthomonas campestris]WVL62222.1 hypothetical protein LLE68_007665 [Xanthomonas campestris pv. barbareae]
MNRLSNLSARVTTHQWSSSRERGNTRNGALQLTNAMHRQQHR